MKQDRFLSGILIGIAVLVVIALVVFFMRRDNLVYVPDDNPSGVVQDYVVAVYKHDYQKAYGYLADLQNKPTFDAFQQAFLSHNVNPSGLALELGKAEISGNNATVSLNVTNVPADPFSTGYRNTDYALLVSQNGVWKIKQMPQYNFWGYDWYPPTGVPTAQPVK